MPAFSFGRNYVRRVERIQETITLILARAKKDLPVDVATDLGDVLRECQELRAQHINLRFWR